MNDIRTFHSRSSDPVLQAMNGLRLHLSGPKTAPSRTVHLMDGDREWSIALDEMLAPLSFIFRTKEEGYAFDDDHPDGTPIERWSAWMEGENERLNEMLLRFMQTEEGFSFLLAMD